MSPGKPSTAEAPALVYARRLPPSVVSRLCALVAGTGAPPAAGAEALAAAAATREGAARILAALPRDARDVVLGLVAERGPRPSGEFEARARNDLGWSRERVRAAMAAADAVGVVAAVSRGGFYAPHVEVFPALAVGARLTCLSWLAGAGADAPRATPLARRLALLVAYSFAQPVAVTASRTLGVRWVDGVQDVFGALGMSNALLVRCVSLLRSLGVLVEGASVQERRTWTVARDALPALGLPDEDLALCLFGAHDAAALLVLAAVERAGAGESEPVDVARVVQATDEVLASRSEGSHVPPLDAIDVASRLGSLASAGLVDVAERDGLLVASRGSAGGRRGETALPSAVPSRPFRCTVLPTFAVLVGEDVDPVGLARLGEVADLDSVDRVAKFQLTKTSIARAALTPEGARGAIDALAAAAEHGMPGNVRATLDGWARSAVALQAYRGAVVVAASDEHAAFLRGRAGVRAEIAPGVFHVHESDLSALLRLAKKAGYPVTLGGTGLAELGSPARPIDAAAEAAAIRSRVARWAVARPKPKPTPTARPSAPLAVVRDAVPSSGPALRTENELRREWPRVARVAGFVPALVQAALRSSVDELDELEDADATSIRGHLLAAMSAPLYGPVGESPPSAPGEASTRWSTPQPGALRTIIETAIEDGDDVRIVYVNHEGVRRELRVRPIRIEQSGARAWMDASLVPEGTRCRYDIDRIAAIRES